MPDGQATLEQELGDLLEQERFDPPEEFVEKALIKDMSEHEAAAKDPAGWWAEQAKRLDWFQEWDTVLDDSDPPFYKWFSGGKINASYNCLDRHVENGRGDKVAFHWRGEEGEERDITYAELLADVKRLASALKDHGIGKGDVVGIFLPMIPEVVVSMLACARIGAPHNVVFGGFSAESVKERMQFSEAKALITVDGARRKGKTAPIKQQVDEVMGEVESIETIVVVRHTEADCEMQDGRDVWYHEALEAADDECEAEPLDAEHPLYILYSSGSTAKPKGILHTTGGYLTQVGWTHKYVFDLKEDEDVFWCSADVGWVTGHSYIVYGPLLNGATSVMYEGAPDYPDKDIWWELCERYGVTIFYTAPTAIRACIKWGARYPEKHDLSKLRLLGTVGEPINPKAWLWYYKVIGGGRCPIVDTWWQTETGGIMITTLPGAQYAKPGSAGTPLPGITARVLDESSGEEAEPEKQGLLVLDHPWPGMLRTLYKDEDRFIETYFKRFGNDTYLVGDAARKDSDGYLWIIGRIDDVLNVSGHRMSTAEIESAIVSHPKVAESAVIGQSDEDSGQAVCAFITLEGDLEGTDELVVEIREHVAKRIGKLARPKRVIWSDDLPKTRSGKIMRRLLRDIAEGRELGDVTTLRDPDVMAQLEGKVKERQSEEDGG
ncbi:MAG: acetyl-CoA synthetase [Solirubrobacteraceae bacterium]|jgi:acetyl-CoA synthetase|nr:acetyl-CoA synthetase [Solirubrobacteraceae bacterium]MEA2392788.1 acetyl-CoA synthetase [Solirubrobacteraceae bacterium]